MNTPAKTGILLAAGLLVVGCGTPPRFEWGQYENRLYAYYRNPDNRPEYRSALENAIDRGEATGRVAPGLNAELGFLYLEDGNQEEAVRHFEREVTLFPESQRFLEAYLPSANLNPDASDVREEGQDTTS